jgi:hypothetical protein
MKKAKLENNPAPVVQLTDLDGTVTDQLFVLLKGQYMARNTSTNYDHTFDGPALIHVEHRTMGRRSYEGDPNDRELWSWINKLAQVGYLVLNNAEALLKGLDHRELSAAELRQLKALRYAIFAATQDRGAN